MHQCIRISSSEFGFSYSKNPFINKKNDTVWNVVFFLNWVEYANCDSKCHTDIFQKFQSNVFKFSQNVKRFRINGSQKYKAADLQNVKITH